MAFSAAVPVMASQNRITRILQQAGAVSAASARSPEDLGLRDSLVLEGLIHRGVVIRTPDGLIHLDPAQLVHWRSTRRRVALVLLLLVLGAVLLWKTQQF